jgi:phage tail-like protein
VTAVETDRDLLPRFANGADGWLLPDASGIEVGPSGELRLQSIPDVGTPAGPTLAVPAGAAPAGCALDETGTGFVSDPDGGRVLVVNRCAPAYAATTDVIGTRASDLELLPGSFVTPRGLVRGPRRRLYVADSGANAVAVIETDRGATTGRWDGMVQPWCLAATAESVYVLDRGGAAGAGRVRCFDADGVEDTAIGASITPLFTDPVRLAVVDDHLLVVDRRATLDAVVPIVLATGELDPGSQQVWSTPVRDSRDPRTGALTRTPVVRIGGIAGGAGRVYLVDDALHDLVTYTLAGDFVGSTRPLQPISDLWLSDEVLWTSPAEPGTLLCHAVDGGRVRTGSFVCGPLSTVTEHGRRELRVRFDRVLGGHLQLWTAVTPAAVPPGVDTLPALGLSAVSMPGQTAWSPLPADVDVALIADPVGPQLFIGGQLAGDGTTTPAVHQLVVSGSRGWIDRLPAVYRKDVAQSDFLDRFLRLLHSVQAEGAQETADLVRRFYARTADDRPETRNGAGVLDALAGWLDVDLDERWDEQRRRAVVTDAFAAQAVRGTPMGLAAAIKERFDIDVVIDEPAQRARIWSLGGTDSASGCACHGEPGGLGFDTMLVAGLFDGAVLGASAVVGQSSLTAGANPGAPLFADLAHRFHISAPSSGVDALGGETALRALVDAERPAHTAYTLCLYGAHARVGLQARVGIDAIVAGSAEPLILDDAPVLQDAALAGAVARPGEPESALVGELRLGRGRLT